MPHIRDNQQELDRFKKSKQIVDMPQKVVSVSTEKEINASAEVKMPALGDPSGTPPDVPTGPGTFSVGTVIAPANALKSNKLTLPKWKQQRLPHQGVVELPQTWVDESTYDKELVYSEDSSSSWYQYQYIAPETRPGSNVYGKTEDGKVLTNAGTFTATQQYVSKATYLNPYTNLTEEINTELREDIKYNDDDSSSSSSGTGLISPLVPAAAADQKQFGEKIIDMPGTKLGDSMDPENYLSLPGRPIKTSETFLYQEESSSSS